MSYLTTTTWGAAVMAFVAMAFGILALATFYEWWLDRRRQKEIRARIGTEDVMARTFDDLIRKPDSRIPEWLEPLLVRLPHLRDLQDLLDQTDLGWNVGSFILLTVGATVAFGTTALFLTNYPIVALVASVLGGTLPYLYVRRKRTSRQNAFLESFSEGIELLSRALRAGHAFSTGLQMVADEAAEPVATEFRTVFEEHKFGLPLDEALYGLIDRMDIPDVHIFVTAVLIQREVGGNLAEVLDTLAETIRERFSIRRQVRVHTAQGRLTGYVLVALPIVMVFLVTALNREYLAILWEEPIGRLLVAVAAILQVVGFFVIRRIVHIEV
ncbi:MAG: type II secretion system F family protein [Gemmatimonadota bacterium]